MAQTILFCSDLTSIEEITVFLYRAIYCKEKVLFFMIGANVFDLEKRENMKSILRDLYQDNENNIYRAYFLCSLILRVS